MSVLAGIQVNGFSIENVTHDEAANALKNTQDFVRLVIAKAVVAPPPPACTGPMSIMSPRRRAPPFTGRLRRIHQTRSFCSPKLFLILHACLLLCFSYFLRSECTEVTLSALKLKRLVTDRNQLTFNLDFCMYNIWVMTIAYWALRIKVIGQGQGNVRVR